MRSFSETETCQQIDNTDILFIPRNSYKAKACLFCVKITASKPQCAVFLKNKQEEIASTFSKGFAHDSEKFPYDSQKVYRN